MLRFFYVLANPLNRITAATDNTRRFGLSNVKYDKNGNITHLTRGGHLKEMPDWDKDDDFGTMDQPDYQYFDGSNRLRSVTDGISKNDTSGKGEFVDGNKVGNDYVYDSNGNMTQDLNKGIKGPTLAEKGIEYNHLNLPTKVSIDDGGANKGTISYIYDATGVKLRKNVLKQGETTPTPTDYAGNYIYENNQLQFFSTPEGTVSPKDVDDYSAGFDYTYNYTDHLGNIRLSYTDANGDGDITTNEIIKESNYYPFGLSHKGYDNNVSSLGNSVAKKYMFGGKEYQDDGLDLGWYDVTARNYDPALCRWMNLDPLAEQMRRHSPYNFGFNNPIYFQDYDGMMPQGPCGDKPCPEEQDNMPPDAIAAKNYFDNLFTNILDSIDDMFSSDDNGSSTNDSASDGKITGDGLQIFGVGGDSEAGSGIVTRNDRGDGKPIETPLLGKNAFNKVLDIAVTIGITVAVVSFDIAFGGSDDNSQSDESTMESSTEDNTSSSESTTIQLRTINPSFGYDPSTGQRSNSTTFSFKDSTVYSSQAGKIRRKNDSIENKKYSEAYDEFYKQ